VAIERTYDIDTQRLTTGYRIEPEGSGPVRTATTVQRLWTADELAAEVREAGLVVEAVRGDLDGRPLDDETDWLVLVARKRRPASRDARRRSAGWSVGSGP